MKEYIIRKRSTAASDVESLSIDNVLWTPDAGIRARASVTYDENAFYVSMTAYESDIRAENTAIDQMPCVDSCLEFFFAPVAHDPRYINIEYNPNALLYFGIGSGRADHLRLFPVNDRFQPRVHRFEDHWSVEYMIPFSVIQTLFPDFRAVSGARVRANFYKCGELTKHEHYLSWNPCTSAAPDFHRPGDFGLLTLE